MTGRTHAIIASNMVWITVPLGLVDGYGIFFIVVGAFAGLLPDIDADHAKIHYIGNGALGMFKGLFYHRRFFHSLLATTILSVVAGIFLFKYHPLFPWIFAGGYLSHLFLDSLTKSGIQLWFPIKKPFRLLPKKWALKVDGQTDRMLFLLGTVSLGLYIFLIYYPLDGLF